MTEYIEFSEADAQMLGLLFEKEMLKTDETQSMQIRKGHACIKVMDQILDELIHNSTSDEDDDAESEE